MTAEPIRHPSPATLFHYTSSSGLNGILCSKSLWATSLQFVNDTAELQAAIDLTKAMLLERAETVDEPRVAKRLREISNGLSNHLLHRDPDFDCPVTVCAVSFSEHHDLLSQWRAYGGEGGYSLGFEFESLEGEGSQLCEPGRWRLVKCVYDLQQQRALIAPIVEWTHEQLEAEVNLPPQLWARLLAIAPQIKHEGFEEEKEWRLVSDKVALHDLKTRSEGPLLKPFQAIRFQGGWVPISQVTVGPQRHQELARLGAAAALGESGSLSTVEISRIPFRAA